VESADIITADDLLIAKASESKSAEPEKESKENEAAAEAPKDSKGPTATGEAVTLFVGNQDDESDDENQVGTAVVASDAQPAAAAAAASSAAEAKESEPIAAAAAATTAAAVKPKPDKIHRTTSLGPGVAKTKFSPKPKVSPIPRDGGMVGRSNLLKPVDRTKLTSTLQELVDQGVLTPDRAQLMMDGADADVNQWQCTFCTFINDGRNPDQCEVCHGKRSRDTKLAAPKHRSAIRKAKSNLLTTTTVMVPKGGEGKLLQIEIGGRKTQVQAPPGLKAGETFQVKVSAPAPAPVSKVRMVNLKLRVPPGGAGKLLQVVVDGVKVRARAPPDLNPGDTFMVQVSWPGAVNKPKATSASVQVVVPPNAQPGSRVLIQTPKGQRAWVVIPNGAKPGQRIMVQL